MAVPPFRDAARVPRRPFRRVLRSTDGGRYAQRVPWDCGSASVRRAVGGVKARGAVVVSVVRPGRDGTVYGWLLHGVVGISSPREGRSSRMTAGNEHGESKTA